MGVDQALAGSLRFVWAAAIQRREMMANGDKPNFKKKWLLLLPVFSEKRFRGREGAEQDLALSVYTAVCVVL